MIFCVKDLLLLFLSDVVTQPCQMISSTSLLSQMCSFELILELHDFFNTI